MIYAQGDTSNIQIQLTQKSAAPLCFLMRLICALGINRHAFRTSVA